MFFALSFSGDGRHLGNVKIVLWREVKGRGGVRGVDGCARELLTIPRDPILDSSTCFFP